MSYTARAREWSKRKVFGGVWGPPKGPEDLIKVPIMGPDLGPIWGGITRDAAWSVVCTQQCTTYG